jgi:2-polyprenyl-3-methyl-5-hydroxy-6-metoxy-1,4-benzoquinol methylase
MPLAIALRRTVIGTFDRTTDVSKLVGCNTRNVPYRWRIFSDYLKNAPSGAAVLDVGAGSLRDTWEMAKLGYRVTALDLDLDLMRRYAALYDWSNFPAPTLTTGPFSALPASSFTFATAFDVIEHLEQPQDQLGEIARTLVPSGILLCSVPNRRTLSEQAQKWNLKQARKHNRKLPTGAPHLQFRSPGEWWKFFENNGFRVVTHDMAIGPIVNTWHSGIQYALVLGKRALPVNVDRMLNVLAPPFLMRSFDVADRATKFASKPLYGWNLFVLRRQSE